MSSDQGFCAGKLIQTDRSRCCNCSSSFGLFRRRHHCRNCGRTVCSECSSGRLLLDGLMVRCCKDCGGRNSSFIESPFDKPEDSDGMNPNDNDIALNSPFILGNSLSLHDTEKLGRDDVNESLEDIADEETVKDDPPQVTPFPLNELNDDPPVLEYSGWHPHSGTFQERQHLQERFGLDLAAVSPDDMRRWYSGDSPWKVALVPPHGGVAFGISYAGFKPNGEMRGQGIAAFAGRWRVGHIEVLEPGKGSASITSIGMALSRPHLDFNRSGAHYLDHVDVPLFGKVCKSQWLICAYASPTTRVVRCLSGFVDAEEEKFPFALETLRSVTIRDAATGREFTGGDGIRSGRRSSQPHASKKKRQGETPSPPDPKTRPLSDKECGPISSEKSFCLPATPGVSIDRMLSIELWSPSRGRMLFTLEHAPKVPATNQTPSDKMETSRGARDSLSSLVQRSLELFGLSQSSPNPSKKKPLATPPPQSQVAAVVTTPQGDSDPAEKTLQGTEEKDDRALKHRSHASRRASSWESSLANAVNKQVQLLGLGDRDDVGPLSPQAVSRLPLCAYCGTRIMLRALDALGHTWHPHCFTCVHCSRPLDAGERFYVDPELENASVSPVNDSNEVMVIKSTDNHSVHCHDCFIEVSYPRCFGCLAHIVDEPAVSAAGHTFHLRCFRCTCCSQNMISGEGVNQTMARYFEHSGMIYCETDFMRLFADTCRACAFPLVKDSSDVVHAVGGLWHAECFVCTECGVKLDGACRSHENADGWGVLGDITYCSYHYSRRLEMEESVLDDSDDERPEERKSRVAGSFRLSLQEEPVRMSFIDAPPPIEEEQGVDTKKPELERKMSHYGVVLNPESGEVVNTAAASFRESMVSSVEANDDNWLSGSTGGRDSKGTDMLPESLVEDFYNQNDHSVPETPTAKFIRECSSGEVTMSSDDEVQSLIYKGLRWARGSQSHAVHRARHIRKQLGHERPTVEHRGGEPANSLDVSNALRFGISALLDRDISGGFQVISSSLCTGRSSSEPRGVSPARRSVISVEEVPAASDPYYPEASDYAVVTQISIETSLESLVPVEKEEEVVSLRGSTASSMRSSTASATVVSFEAHAPAVFKAIRRRFFGMDDDSYFDCMCKTALSNVTTGAGKSGSYFLYSSDKRLIIKSVRSSEFPFLVRILEAYMQHMEANHFHSLLPRFLGLYKVKLPRLPAERLLVMNNVFYAPDESRISHSLSSAPIPSFVSPPPSPGSSEAVSDLTSPPLSAHKNAADDEPSSGRSANSSDSEASPQTRRKSFGRVRQLSLTRAMYSVKDRFFGEGKRAEPRDEAPAEVIEPVPAQPPTPVSSSEPPNRVAMPSKQRQESLRPITMSQIFDLKGSLLKRFVSEEEQSRGERVLKDLNFCGYHQGTDNKGNVVARRGLRCRKLRVGKERWPSLGAALMNDIEWLRSHNIMDYSLLVGVGIVPKKTLYTDTRGWSHLSPSCYSEWVKDSGGLRARDASEEEKGIVYYIGVIDILQEFNMGKRMESAYKQRLQMMAGKDPTLISAVDASVYAKRFLEFMTNHIE